MTETSTEPATPPAASPEDSAGIPYGEDSRLDRFDRWRTRRFTARDAIVAILVSALLLVAASGTSIRNAGDQMSRGLGRDIVLGIGARPHGSASACRCTTSPTRSRRGSRPTRT